MQTQLSKIGSTPRGTAPLMQRSVSSNQIQKGLASSARGKQALSAAARRKAARAQAKAGKDPLAAMLDGSASFVDDGGDMMGTGMMMNTKSKPSVVDRRTTPRRDNIV